MLLSFKTKNELLYWFKDLLYGFTSQSLYTTAARCFQVSNSRKCGIQPVCISLQCALPTGPYFPRIFQPQCVEGYISTYIR